MSGRPWRLSVDGAQVEGQFSTADLEVRMQALAGRDIYVWREGMSDWTHPDALPDFQAPAKVAPRATATPAGAGLSRLECEWCRGQNAVDAVSCRSCGAPLDIKNLVSASGWREAPRVKDMTEIEFGSSTCQVEGEIVPVAEIKLGQGDSVFFEHHVLLWKEEAVPMSVLPLQGGMKRALAGMPFIISVATGPGRIAFSRDATGELVLPALHVDHPTGARTRSRTVSRQALPRSRSEPDRQLALHYETVVAVASGIPPSWALSAGSLGAWPPVLPFQSR